jgi:hypothetical protein
MNQAIPFQKELEKRISKSRWGGLAVIFMKGDNLNLLTYWKWGLDLGQIGCDLKRDAPKFLKSCRSGTES